MTLIYRRQHWSWQLQYIYSCFTILFTRSIRDNLSVLKKYLDYYLEFSCLSKFLGLTYYKDSIFILVVLPWLYSIGDNIGLFPVVYADRLKYGTIQGIYCVTFYVNLYIYFTPNVQKISFKNWICLMSSLSFWENIVFKMSYLKKETGKIPCFSFLQSYENFWN